MGRIVTADPWLLLPQSWLHAQPHLVRT